MFVNSVSDLFHDQVPDEFIDKVFGIMALAPRHTFQMLTKRPERMADYLAAGHYDLWGRWGRASAAMNVDAALWIPKYRGVDPLPWPLPNVWCGTSVEDQKAADERIPHLLRTLAAVRFLSCEPLLGPVDLFGDLESPGPAVSVQGGSYTVDYGTGREWDAYLQPEIDWVIVGGESGPNFRPMDPNWARQIRDDCVAAGVAYFFKQHSGLRPASKKQGPPTLDGEVWHQFPGEASEVMVS